MASLVAPFTANESDADDRCAQHLELECDYPSRTGKPGSYRCGELVTTRGPTTKEAKMVVAEAEAVHLVPSPGGFSCIPCGAQVNVPAANSASQRVAAIDNGWIACSARGLVRSTGVLSAAAGAATLVASFRSGPEGYIAAAVGGDVIVEVAATGELVAGNPSWSGPIDDAAELRWHASEPSCVVRVRTGALSLIDVASGGKSWSGKTIPSDAWDGGLSVCSVAWSPLAGKKLLACGLGAGASTAWGGTFKIERNEVRCGSIVVIDLERGAPIARFGCPLFYSGTSSSPHPAGVVAASCETIRWVPRGVEGSTIFAGYVTHCPANDADWGGDDDTPPRDGVTIRPIHRAEPSMDPYRQVNRTAAPTLCALEPRGQLDSVGDAYVDDFLFPYYSFWCSPILFFCLPFSTTPASRALRSSTVLPSPSRVPRSARSITLRYSHWSVRAT